MEAARARVNWGRWIADCPEPFCANAEDLNPTQPGFHCTVCHLVAAVEWPPDPDSITAALEARPRLATRNWYPAEHPEAVRLSLPHGQTAADLHTETRDHEGQD